MIESSAGGEAAGHIRGGRSAVFAIVRKLHSRKGYTHKCNTKAWNTAHLDSSDNAERDNTHTHSHAHTHARTHEAIMTVAPSNSRGLNGPGLQHYW